MEDWNIIEVNLIIADYFQMLSFELAGLPYSKAEHRRQLLPLLNSRSEGSIEFKHQNISAVLVRFGQPYISGYKPRYNYQRFLEDKVVEYLQKDQRIEGQFRDFADKGIEIPHKKMDYDSIVVEPPDISMVCEPGAFYQRSPIKVNYLEKEQANRILGRVGEEFVLEYEKWSLKKAGMTKLLQQIRWVSKEDGDGAGYDILSKYPNGNDKFIEVKTTKLGKETPFYFSRNELEFSKKHDMQYNLFRLYNFEKGAKMFIKNGSLDTICMSTPVSYMGYF